MCAPASAVLATFFVVSALRLVHAQVNTNVVNRIPTEAEIAAGANPYVALQPAPNPATYGKWYFNGYSPINGQGAMLTCNSDRVLFFDFPQPAYRPFTLSNQTSLRPQLGWIDYNTAGFNGSLAWNPGTNAANQDFGFNMACAGYVPTLDGGGVVHAGHGWAAGHQRGDYTIHRLRVNSTTRFIQFSARKYLVSEQSFVNQRQWGSNLYCTNKTIHSRWYPTPVPLPDGRHYVAGGAWTQGSSGRCWTASGNEIYNPVNNQLVRVNWTKELQEDNEFNYAGAKCNGTKAQGGMGGIGCYPYVALIPRTGHLLVIGYKVCQIITVEGQLVAQLPSFTARLPNLRILFPHPGTVGTFGFTAPGPGPINFTVAIMGGGTSVYAATWRPASKYILTLPITQWPNGTYLVPAAWELEEMPYPRAFGDFVLLPNKRVVLINGAAEYHPNPRGNKPVTSPLLYISEAAKGQRFVIYAKTSIPRTYHSTGYLNRQGCIFVGGCTECNNTRTFLPFGPHPNHTELTYSPYGQFEFRIETFCPHYKFNPTATIVSLLSRNVTYGANFTLHFSLGTQRLKRVTLLTPGSVTHGVHMGRSLVELNWRVLTPPNGTLPGVLQVTAPPDGTWAPPGICHIIHLVTTNNAYSVGEWIRFIR